MDQHGLPRYHNFLLVRLIYHSKENLVGPIYAKKLVESGCLYVFNRPGVAGAVLQTPSSLIDSVSESVSQPFPPNLQDIINHKP